MINIFLYHFTPYGVLKYSLTYNKQVDLNDTVVVASMEASMINDIKISYNSVITADTDAYIWQISGI